MNYDYNPDIAHDTLQNGLEVRYQNGYLTGSGVENDENVNVRDENRWMDKIIALAKHIEIQNNIH